MKFEMKFLFCKAKLIEHANSESALQARGLHPCFRFRIFLSDWMRYENGSEAKARAQAPVPVKLQKYLPRSLLTVAIVCSFHCFQICGCSRFGTWTCMCSSLHQLYFAISSLRAKILMFHSLSTLLRVQRNFVILSSSFAWNRSFHAVMKQKK